MTFLALTSLSEINYGQRAPVFIYMKIHRHIFIRYSVISEMVFRTIETLLNMKYVIKIVAFIVAQ